MNKPKIVGELILLSAAMARGTGLPSPYLIDHSTLPKMSKKARLYVQRQFEKANEQSRRWGVSLRDVTNEIIVDA